MTEGRRLADDLKAFRAAAARLLLGLHVADHMGDVESEVMDFCRDVNMPCPFDSEEESWTERDDDGLTDYDRRVIPELEKIAGERQIDEHEG